MSYFVKGIPYKMGQNWGKIVLLRGFTLIFDEIWWVFGDWEKSLEKENGVYSSETLSNSLFSIKFEWIWGKFGELIEIRKRVQLDFWRKIPRKNPFFFAKNGEKTGL